MAIRRMFSKQIINSARFIKMPTSSQLLYFHLSLNADDDGVVEGYNVMRMINCTEDDLHILVAKSFVIVMNEDLVTYITDWTEHNLIRPDRKVDSIYKNLLIKIIADRCPTNDGQLTDRCQHRVVKDRVVKESIDIEHKKEKSSTYTEEIETLWSLYPNKKGKAAAIKSIPKLLKVMEYEELKRCVERYIKASKKTEVQYLQYGSTFFNGGYMDYKDKVTDINKVIKPKMEIEVKNYG